MKKIAIAMLFAVLTCPPVNADEIDGLSDSTIGVVVIPVSFAYDGLKKNGIKLPIKSGMLVTRVIPGSPAEKAKIKAYDIILKVRGKTFRDVKAFAKVIGGFDIGKEYSFTGYSYFQLRGKAIWKKGTVKITPTSKQDMILGVLGKTYDKVNGITFCRHVNSPKYINTSSEIYCYILIPDNGKPSLMMKTQYVAKEWLFIKEIVIKADEEKFTWEMSRFSDVERDNSGGKIWEWQNKSVSEEELKMLESIAKADSVVIRYNGSQYHKDRDMGDNEKARIGEVIRAFKVLTSKAGKENK